MDIVVEKLILFLVVFTIIYLGYYILVIRKYNKNNSEKLKKSKKQLNDRIEIQFLVKKYKIDIKNIDINQLLWDISFTNSFIMATTVVVIGLEIIDGYIWQLLLGIVVLVPLILLGYFILGKKYKSKERRGK